VQELREPKGTSDSEANNEGAQSFLPIEFKILRSIDQIKTGHPADYTRAEEERSKRLSAGRRDPGASGRDRERQAQEKMTRGSEALR